GRGEQPDLRQPGIDQDGGVVGARDAVVPPPPVSSEDEGKTREPNGYEGEGAKRDAAGNPTPPGARRQPDGEHENDELDKRRADPQKPQPALIGLASLQMAGAEEFPRIQVREVEVTRNRCAPQQRRRD